MEPRRSKHYLARIPTIALLVLFAMSPELSILFFILRAIDRDALKKSRKTPTTPAISGPRTPARTRAPAPSAATTRPFTATTSPPPSRRTRKSGTRT